MFLFIVELERRPRNRLKIAISQKQQPINSFILSCGLPLLQIAGMRNQFPGHKSHAHHPHQQARVPSTMMDNSVFTNSEQRLPSPRHSAWTVTHPSSSSSSSNDVGSAFHSPLHSVPYPPGRLPTGALRGGCAAPAWNPDGRHSCSSGSSASSCSSCGLNGNGGGGYEKKDGSVELLVGWLSSAGFSE